MPLEQLYANAALMVGAPMTFFALLKNLTDTYIVSKRDSGARMLQVRTLATSALAIAIAFAMFAALIPMLSVLEGTTAEYAEPISRSFADVVTSLVPPSIFEPFEAVLPIPLMVVALLCAYAMCSAGKYFDALRHAMMACYTLFSRMLRVGIVSAIDAAPFNIRYCSKTLKMDRAMLERNLPVLAEINLDGNCFIIMFFTLVFALSSSMSLPWFSYVGLAALVLFLSLGAPNQPGSILIGTLIVIMYLNSSAMLCAAIYTEVFLGGAQNLINVVGDIVMVAIEDSKEKARSFPSSAHRARGSRLSSAASTAWRRPLPARSSWTASTCARPASTCRRCARRWAWCFRITRCSTTSSSWRTS